MTKRLCCIVLLSGLLTVPVLAQRIALKTNLLYWGILAPNLELEARLAPKLTGDVSVAGSFATLGKYKLNFTAVEPEVRYWMERPMARHYVGVAGLFANYHMHFGEKRHLGDAMGAGLVYGYAFVLGQRWNLETSLGVGLAHFREKRYRDVEPEEANHKGWAVVPMRIGVTLSYVIR